MRLEVIQINKLVPYENNPRQNENAIAAVRESIRQCGYNSPIVADENLVILAGHTRLKALLEMGTEEVEVLIADGLTDEQKKKYRILDNKTAELSEWDFNKLALEIAGLDFDNFDFQLEEQISPDLFDEEFSLPDGDKSEFNTVTFNLKNEQWDLISACIDKVEDEVCETYGNTQKLGNGLHEIVRQWFEMRQPEGEDEWNL